MNWFDLTIISVIGLSVIVSLFRGLIREVLSLLIWIGAFWLAWHFVDDGAELIVNWVDLPSARHLIAFVALFLAALIVGGIINYLVGQLISKTGLAASDRFFGMFFGLARGVVAVTAIVFFVKATPLSQDPWWQQSRLAPYFSDLAEWARERMPAEISAYFKFMDKEANTNPEISQPQTDEVSPNEES
ncbi:CvpA family protein [Marinicella sp. W31]|uniref:CvpA family protein n=1 Tax=Marinicella sp. W31 TaxID=3023713 RepID=UPI003756C488